VIVSDRIDRFNFRMGLGLARCPFLSLSLILEYGSKASGLDMMMKAYVLKAVDDDRWIKDGNPWRIGSWCLNMRINAELELTLFHAKLMHNSV